MTKNERISKLFSKNFKDDDIFKIGPAKAFSCIHEKECDVNKKEEPIWSAAICDENTNIMIVGEAPSNTGGPGPHLGGLFKDWEANKKSHFDAQRKFVKKYYHTIPYFTDLVKCGVAKQSNKKKLNKRIERCSDYLLVKEIQIIRPKFILCAGGVSHSILKKRQKENKIDSSIKLVPLMHYSRQAGLPLSIEDKLNIIWKWQTNSGSRNEIKKMPLSVLSYFKKSP